MRASVVVELDPIAQYTHGVLLALNAMTVYALLFEGADDPFNHPVLLRAMRGDERLLQAIAANPPRVIAAGEDQAVVRT